MSYGSRCSLENDESRKQAEKEARCITEIMAPSVYVKVKLFSTRIVGCTFAHQVWKRLENRFASQIKAKVMQLKNRYRSAPPKNDHVNAIINDLTEAYAPLITSRLTRPQSISVDHGDTIKAGNRASLKDRAKAMIILRRHLD
ncbi:hypothetical protein PIB30_058170 [Stylosanthes scabra]|uniref:Uncharacterized protein n=1 Tax=Stylosanthes scabra TaxID=79078 RepID=A0ABU6SK04_9FABA|nr:hypothetical protein [Stylosanthes scabra]